MDRFPVACFTVVLPVKPLGQAKSRLDLPPATRRELVLAMAADTVAAALAATLVRGVLVVTDDPQAAKVLTGLGALVVPDRPRAGLNAALSHGVAAARESWPGCHAATLSADLPALRTTELDTALRHAELLDRSMVPDAAGDGTTLLAARTGVRIAPAYGAGSRQRHERAGHRVIELPAASGLRRDVDTLADLATATEHGLGEFSAAVVTRIADEHRSPPG